MMANDLRPIKIISAPIKVLTLFGQRHFGYERNLKTGKQLCDLRPVHSLALRARQPTIGRNSDAVRRSKRAIEHG
jgi:hypothetical protein